MWLLAHGEPTEFGLHSRYAAIIWLSAGSTVGSRSSNKDRVILDLGTLQHSQHKPSKAVDAKKG